MEENSKTPPSGNPRTGHPKPLHSFSLCHAPGLQLFCRGALRRGESRLTPQIARKVMDQFRRLAGSSEYVPDAVNPAIASRFQAGRQWRGVADPGRWKENL